ncbi:hypothetical protein TRFO_33989 [Tritrichomonas foetus]|uniref:Uncharacterized protein n=1 Tax=Tritrichomonas foetus TaxID=1144522 RepID=A0A1J4JM88_9EUKA|nr:hypothetical protein TRFO_33989 [Tritrichomonas foetus]|eukprot:OHS99535.1 hypothetical protein TRFO_33989 [Tritrichomonas foetus]
MEAERSELLNSIIEKNVPSTMSPFRDIADLSENEKIELYNTQKIIICQFRQQANAEIQQTKEKLQDLLDTCKRLGISFSDPQNGNTDVPNQQNASSEIEKKNPNANTNESTIQNAPQKPILNPHQKLHQNLPHSNNQTLGKANQALGKGNQALNRMKPKSTLAKAPALNVNQNKAPIKAASSVLNQKSEMTSSRRNTTKSVTPACFIAIDNKLKQINMEIRALTRKQEMIVRSLKQRK